MERIKRSLKGRYWRKVITYFLTCCLFLNTSLPAVMAGPAGGVVDTTNGGAAEILYEQGINEHTTQVNVATTRTIINWDSLNTAGGDAEARETLAFSQGGLTGSAVLNRISGDITHFGGDLSAPGMRIFMVNPAGIMFDGGSTVNVTQLVASGLGMTNDAFHAVLDDPVNNKMEFLTGEGEVVSRAIITADSVYLIGKKVYNIGPIIAKNGLVVMAAGDEVRLFEDGSDVSVVVNSEGDGFDNPDIRNSGRVDVPNGKIVLAAGDTFSRAISIHGIVTAQGGTVTAKAALVEHIGKIDVSAYPSGADGDGGSISLTGTERVVIGPEGTPGEMFANAGANGNGGDITIQTGKLTINETSSITATGGSVSGDGGSVTITCDDFEIAGDIYASPGNKINEPGKLEINTPSVIIADGANAGETDTLYEDDIENLSLAGTSLVVNAEEGITVKDIDDNEITGKFGDIKLLADMENPDSFVSFEESSNTIRTSLGDIVIEAGGGGIDVGNLITGKDLADEKPAPGQIFLTTGSEGDITTGDLIIESGWRHAEINVKSDSDLTVNGDVRVGMNEDGVKSSILNVPPDASAEAMIYLKAADNVVLEGDVYADAHGKDEAEDQTKAYIEIIAGGDVEINDDLYASVCSPMILIRIPTL